MSDPAARQHSDHPSALPPGTRLGEFEVLGLLGIGGFGIVYRAFDHALEREVAVKEYMPASLAGRTETLHVSVRSQADVDTFALGLRSFVNEAKLLARFDHPSLLKVHRFWEANGTAYMAMPVMRGRTVKALRAEMPQPPDEAWLRALLVPLLGAMEKLHSEGVYHRDIAPDNIQVEPDGHPVLLDFGAARRVIGDKSQALTAILKPAYAPIEQYAEAGAVRQGPWTDIYALGATLHYLLLHRPPPPATARAVHDDASALDTTACPACSETFLRTVDWMLAPRPADRPQSVAALREVLDGRRSPPLRRVDTTPPPSEWDRTVVLGAGAARRDETPVEPAAAGLKDPPEPPDLPDLHVGDAGHGLPPVAPPPPAAGRPKWLPAAAGLLALAGAAAAWVFWPQAPAPQQDAAAGAASAAGAAASVFTAAAPAASLPAAQQVPESAITTVIVPTQPAARAAARSVAAETPAPERSSTRPPAPRSAAVVPGASSPAAAATRPETPPAAAPTTAAPRQAGNTAAAAAGATPASQPPTASEAAATAGPEAKCGARNPLSYFFCMERECLRAQFGSHPDCLKWRAEARSEPRN